MVPVEHDLQVLLDILLGILGCALGITGCIICLVTGLVCGLLCLMLAAAHTILGLTCPTMWPKYNNFTRKNLQDDSNCLTTIRVLESQILLSHPH